MPRAQKISWGLRQEIFERDDWKCRHCGNRQTLDPHHVIFRSQGGDNDKSNLLTLCRRCHDAVHDRHLLIEVVERRATDLVVKFWKQKGWKS
jgi:5-methylcytosine-specific restriction endonuclease McrA